MKFGHFGSSLNTKSKSAKLLALLLLFLGFGTSCFTSRNITQSPETYLRSKRFEKNQDLKACFLHWIDDKSQSRLVRQITQVRMSNTKCKATFIPGQKVIPPSVLKFLYQSDHPKTLTKQDEVHIYADSITIDTSINSLTIDRDQISGIILYNRNTGAKPISAIVGVILLILALSLGFEVEIII